MNKLKVAIIGVGAIAESAHVPGIFNVPAAQLTVICDKKAEQLEYIGKQFNLTEFERDYKAVLNRNDVDAVIIATDAEAHEEIILASLDAGKHVFVEKPMTLSSEGAERVVVKQKETGLKVMVGYQLRFMPNHIKVREYVRNGLIGKLYLGHLRAETLVIKPEETLLIDYGTHFFDLIRWYFEGEKITAVSGMIKLDSAGIQVGATTNITFGDNIQTVVETYWVPKWNWSNVNRSVEFIGENGKISTQMSIPEIKLWRCNSKRDQIFGERVFAPKEASNVYMSAGDIAYSKQLEIFVDCVLNDKPVPTTAYDGLMALKIAEASLKSSKEKKIITNIE